MDPINPTTPPEAFLKKSKKNPAALRFWHWANAIVITGSLITVLVNSTILKARKSAPLVQETLKKDSLNLSISQAKDAVHVLSDKVWDVHVYFGYFLAGLLLLRIIAEFFNLAEQKFINQLKNIWQQYFVLKQDRDKWGHKLLVKSLYIVFYLLLVIMVVTGLCLAFDDSLPIAKSIMHSIKSVHGFCMYPILVFIGLHVLGVIVAEHNDDRGIVSDMIHGG